MKKQTLLKRLPLTVAVMSSIASTASVQAYNFDFDDSEFSASANVTLSYAAEFRAQNAQDDSNWNGLNNGAELRTPNAGNVISNIFSTKLELSADWRNYGFISNMSYQYDAEIMHGKAADPFTGEQTQWSDAAKDYNGNVFQLQDAYVYGTYDVGEMPLEIRAGKQVINWGEGLFFMDGISTQSPLNINKLVTPGAELKEAYIGNMGLSAQMGIGDESSIEAYVQSEWNRAEFAAAGTFYGSDAFFRGGDEAWTSFGAPMRDADVEAKDSGQWGIAGRTTFGDVEVGLYYSKYHDSLPTLSVDNAGNSVFGLNQVWAEDQEMFGASISTTIGTWSFAGEIAHRPDRALFGDIVGKGYVNVNPGADYLTNVSRNDTTSISFNGIWLGGPTFMGIDAQYAIYQVAGEHIAGDRSNLAAHNSISRNGSDMSPLDPSLIPDTVAYGAALNWGGTWQNVIPASDLTLDLYVQRGIKGNSHFWGNFAEDATLGAVSLIGTYGTAFEASLSYAFWSQKNSDYEDQDTISISANYKF